MTFQVIRGNDVPGSHLPFSPGILAGGFLFVSGQASVDKAGQIVVDTFEGEFRRSMENVQKVLAGAGLTLSDVVQVRCYVDSPDDLAEYNKLYRDVFREPFPARSTIVNCLGGKLKFEIDVVAYAASGESR